MKLKKLFVGALLATLGAATLASCTKTTEKRNQVTPYGNLNSKLDTTFATADGDLKMTVGQYYTQLRKSGYSTVTAALNKYIYADEVKAMTGLYQNATRADFISNVGKESLAIFEYVDAEGDSKTAQDKLFDLTSDTEAANKKYLDLRKKIMKDITNNIAGSLFSTTSAKAIEQKTEKDLNTLVAKYIDSLADEGIFIQASDIKYTLPTDSTYFNKEDDIVNFDSSTLDVLKDKVNDVILTQSRYLAGRKALFQVADEEYIYDEDSKDDIKNTNYLFKDTAIKSTYESKYKTYGEYNAVVIQFNSRKEAMDAIQSIGGAIDKDDLENAKAKYLELYKNYYSYKKTPTSTSDDEFKYVVNKDKDDLSDLSSSISTLIKDVLEDGQYLTEPRNMNNKYVMALRISATYDYNTGDSSKQADFTDFDEDKQKEIANLIKEDLLLTNTSYSAQVDHKRYGEANIKVYDPYFEYQFNNAYSEEYDLITDAVTNESDAILTAGDDFKYTVDDFFNDASKKYANNIITNYFQLEYVNAFYDTFVDLYYIDEDLAKTNKETLEAEISKFKKNNNSTYPVELGLETYLLASYGYTNKEDILKYYYNATKALTVYRDIKVYDSWQSAEANEDGEYSITDVAKNGFLNNLLNTGNKNYSELFEINLDHFLINIDDDADGSPDDPDKFLQGKTDEEKADFEQAVVELAQAIYKEAIYPAYKNSTLVDTLKFIKTQYEEGDVLLLSDHSKTWNDYKKYNFLITVEQLASTSNITQDSVSNFVKPFKDYVISLYKSVSTLENDTYKEQDKSNKNTYKYTNGKFYLVTDVENNQGQFVTTTEDADLITANSLCKTSFGYHMLLINSYKTPQYLTFTSDSASDYLKNIELTIRSYTDSDDKTQTIKVLIDSLNEPETAGEELTTASFNQFFIYYIQKANGESTSLDSSIYEIMCKLFDDVYGAYTSSTFQNYLLLNQLNIQITSNDALFAKVIDAHMANLVNTITEYGENDDYASWVDGSLDWTRPALKKESN